jgi:heat shock protein HslJ
VRDGELAKSKVTFLPRGEVSVATGCYGFSAILQSKSSPDQILGFSRILSPAIGCPSNQSQQANTTTMRLFRETANIARAGNTITFLNNVGNNIAQWTAAPSPPAMQESRAPQPGAPQPSQVRVIFGDYVVTEVSGIIVSTVSAQAPSTNPAQPLTATAQQPTFFLRENGQVTGSSGCNQFSSVLVRGSDGSTRFGPVVTSKRACLNSTMRATETAFFMAMRRAVRVDVSASQVLLFGPNGQPSARLSAIGARGEAGPTLYGKTWVLRRFNGTVISQPDPPTIVFTGNKVSGSTGCFNQFDLDHSRQNGQSRFTNVIMTEMGCGDRRRNDLQIRYVTQLERVTIIVVTSNSLTLRSPDNTTNMVFDAP